MWSDDCGRVEPVWWAAQRDGLRVGGRESACGGGCGSVQIGGCDHGVGRPSKPGTDAQGDVISVDLPAFGAPINVTKPAREPIFAGLIMRSSVSIIVNIKTKELTGSFSFGLFDASAFASTPPYSLQTDSHFEFRFMG